MQYKRISADCHLDLPWLPPELFVSQVKRELKERMPYVEDGPDGPHWITKAGVNMGLVGGIGSVGGKFVPGQNYRVDKMAETGLYEDGKKGVRRPGDPDQRIKDMDRDGVDAEIIFGILGVASRIRDHEAANEMLRIYNGWLKDFCGHYPDRQIGLACLPYGDIEAAVEEVYRVAKLGLKGLERYPNLRIGLGESGIGWLPYALDRMDFEYEDRFRDLMKLKPSEYWRRQCRATFQFDRIGAKLVEDIGVETLMWGSDYPHPDGVWPESSKYIVEQFAGLAPEVVHKITCENAAKFYNLIN